MNSKFPFIIALEGMPRGGKSTTLARLKAQTKLNIHTFEELYFSDEQLAALKDKKGTLVESKWFLDKEVERLTTLTSMDCDQIDAIVIDRMYLSTLAYCYARANINNDIEEFNELVRFYKKRRNRFIQYNKVIVFNTSIENSQSIRRPNREEDDGVYWMDKYFMHHYQDFYQKQCQLFTSAPIHQINSDNHTLDEIYYEVLDIIIQNYHKYK